MQSSVFRSRNLKSRHDRQQQDKTKVLQTSSSFRTNVRSTSCVRNESTLYKSALVFSNRKDNQELLHNFNSDLKRQIASLTKIMTCFTALEFVRIHNLLPEDLQCQVSKQAAGLGGTCAGLEEGDVISLWDLLYGLMLPSGNDAALCIAENIGKRMIENTRQKQRAERASKSRLRRRELFRKNHQSQSQAVSLFVQQMNKNAERLGMSNTQYNNPHGLADHLNYSTSKDQLLLIQKCLQNKLFRRIVKTKLYFGCVRTKGDIWTREIIWQNTNRLLNRGYQGIKTGNTTSAGYCLASWFSTPESDLIIIVLGCGSKEERDFHTLRLTKENLQKAVNK